MIYDYYPLFTVNINKFSMHIKHYNKERLSYCYLFHFPSIDNEHDIVDGNTGLSNVGGQNLPVAQQEIR